jgi:hypothetical protein
MRACYARYSQLSTLELFDGHAGERPRFHIDNNDDETEWRIVNNDTQLPVLRLYRRHCVLPFLAMWVRVQDQYESAVLGNRRPMAGPRVLTRCASPLRHNMHATTTVLDVKIPVVERSQSILIGSPKRLISSGKYCTLVIIITNFIRL